MELSLLMQCKQDHEDHEIACCLNELDGKAVNVIYTWI